MAGQAAQHQQLQVLQANFRNTQAVTELTNTTLKVKQARFGPIDVLAGRQAGAGRGVSTMRLESDRCLSMEHSFKVCS